MVEDKDFINNDGDTPGENYCLAHGSPHPCPVCESYAKLHKRPPSELYQHEVDQLRPEDSGGWHYGVEQKAYEKAGEEHLVTHVHNVRLKDRPKFEKSDEIAYTWFGDLKFYWRKGKYAERPDILFSIGKKLGSDLNEFPQHFSAEFLNKLHAFLIFMKRKHPTTDNGNINMFSRRDPLTGGKMKNNVWMYYEEILKLEGLKK